MKKIKKEEKLLEDIINITPSADIAQAITSVDLTLKHQWLISNANLDIAKKLGLTKVNKY